MLALPEGTRFTVDAPIVRGRKGEFKDVLEDLRSDGFTRVKIDGEQYLLDEPPTLDKQIRHTIAVVVDRLVMKQGLRARLTDSVETALRLAEGLVEVSEVDGATRTYSERFACPDDGISLPELAPRIFSFNSPHGACPRCTGLGTQREIDPELIVPDPTLSIARGRAGALDGDQQRLLRAGDPGHRRPLRDLAGDAVAGPARGAAEAVPVRHRRREGVRHLPQPDGPQAQLHAGFEGIVPSLERRYRETDSNFQKERIEEYMTLKPCPLCHGARLKETSLAVTVSDLNISQFTELSVERAIDFVDELELTDTERAIGARILKEIRERLSFLENVGVGYLTLNRAAGTLSGGEAQRIRLATQIGSSLMGVLYILDEPSIGLHQRDNARLLATLERLRDLGNTVIVVEHDEETMRAADHIVDMGPGAGEHGGQVVADGHRRPGDGEQAVAHRRVPERPPRDPGARPAASTTPAGSASDGAAEHNLQVDRRRAARGQADLRDRRVRLGQEHAGQRGHLQGAGQPGHAAPREAGRAHGSVHGIEAFDKVIDIDQSPIGRTPRSNPATYTGLFDHIRELYAQTPESRARGYKPGRFSFNVKGGRCETCRGDGTIKIEMHFLPDVYINCEVCHGRRYNRETLEVKFKGKSIADVLDMPVEEALEFFAKVPKLRRRLQTLHDVGLDYMRLGQPATTLSGGEAQRVKLATELSKVATGRTLYILDEPTTGLHTYDIEKLLLVLQRLVDAGNTVLVIEHNLDVIKQADWVLDLGPEGGDKGGEIIAQGTPEEVAETPGSATGEFLRRVLPVYEAERALA